MPQQGSLLNQNLKALKRFYGEGQYRTLYSHIDKMNPYYRWLKEAKGLRNFKEVNLELRIDHAELIAERVADEEIVVSTGHNTISAFNITMQAVNGNHDLDLSPSKYAGKRSHIRTEIPLGMDKTNVFAAANHMRMNGYEIHGDLVEIMREAALRKKESALQNYQRVIKTVTPDNHIRIMEGTKGGTGKFTERWVPVNDRTLDIISNLADRQGDWKSIIPKEMTLYSFMNQLYAQWYRVRDEFGLGKLHDLRACAACDWFEQETGFTAPIFKQGRPDKKIERMARKVISGRVGHGRPEVSNSYIGGSR